MVDEKERETEGLDSKVEGARLDDKQKSIDRTTTTYGRNTVATHECKRQQWNSSRSTQFLVRSFSSLDQAFESVQDRI
jgi:hypothetical protein